MCQVAFFGSDSCLTMAASSHLDPNMHPGLRRVAEVSRASACISKHGEQAMSVACEAAKEVLSRSFDAILHRNQGSPLLTSKSCDGTPLNTVERSRLKLPSGRVIQTQGRAGHEFLVKLQWLRALHADGSHESAVLLQEATPLTHGKKVPALISACTRHWRSLSPPRWTGTPSQRPPEELFPVRARLVG